MSDILLNDLKFEALLESDFPLLLEWLSSAHMQGKWNKVGSISDIENHFSCKIGSDWQHAFIISTIGKKFAYLQSYQANKAGLEWSKAEADSTIGINQFIGDETFLRKGYGTQIVRDFSDWLLSFPHIERIITDPALDNEAAIRCYHKAGFMDVEIIGPPGGKMLLMEKLQ